MKRIAPVPVLGMRLQMHCADRAGLGLDPVWGMQLRVHCVNRAVPVPLLGIGEWN